jgi:carbamoyltransferase
MTILGISLTHDGTLTIVKDGVNIFSIGEERLNRRKAYIGFPFEALRYVLAHGVVEPASVDIVAISSGMFKKEWARSFAFELTEKKRYYDIQNDKAPADFFMDDTEWEHVTSDEECKAYVTKKIRALLDEQHIAAPIEFHDHHLCHTASAYIGSGKREALVVTLDGEGDVVSGTISTARDGVITSLCRMPVTASIGYLYSEVTRKCGFKMSRHEGKITGLAAYGGPQKSSAYFNRAVQVIDGAITFPGQGTTFAANLWYRLRAKLGLRPYAGNFWRAIIEDAGPLSKEDLSAGVQWVLEEKVAELVSYWVAKTGIGDVAVAGGVFANVKLNQRIAELAAVNSVFVFPDMGDGGNAYGAAMLSAYAHGHTWAALRMEHAYLGPAFSHNEVQEELEKHPELTWRVSPDITKEAAELVANKKIVGWFQGRMEYGPRALGNRSVIAHPTDASINKWLNDRMKRTEFMPFAPSCLSEAADELFYIQKPSMKIPAEFMTITFTMKEAWAQKAPAVAHIDGTARPQLVRKDTNPRFHALITHYRTLTGLPLLINTSFNVHEEPIVCSPKDALSSLKNGMIDVLAIEDFIVTRA